MDYSEDRNGRGDEALSGSKGTAYIVEIYPHTNYFKTNLGPIEWTLKMKAACSSETSISTYKATYCQNPEVFDLNWADHDGIAP